MKIIAVMPLKLNNERLPGKNTKLLGGKPLLRYELENLLKTKRIDKIYVYCSDERIVSYLPIGIEFLKRPAYLDLPTSNFTQIFEEFSRQIDADIYVYAHATAPYVTVDTMNSCIDAVKLDKFDSSFCAVKIQDYLWQNGRPLNFDAKNVPRSQDLIPIYRETSGVYVFTREVFKLLHQRIGNNPFVREVTFKEAIDINNLSDFQLAEKFFDVGVD